jgi:hypothetical protein
LNDTLKTDPIENLIEIDIKKIRESNRISNEFQKFDRYNFYITISRKGNNGGIERNIVPGE